MDKYPTLISDLKLIDGDIRKMISMAENMREAVFLDQTCQRETLERVDAFLDGLKHSAEWALYEINPYLKTK